MNGKINVSVYSSIKDLVSKTPEGTFLNCKSVSGNVVGGFAVVLEDGEVVMLPKDTIITIKEVGQ